MDANFKHIVILICEMILKYVDKTNINRINNLNLTVIFLQEILKMKERIIDINSICYLLSQLIKLYEDAYFLTYRTTLFFNITIRVLSVLSPLFHIFLPFRKSNYSNLE